MPLLTRVFRRLFKGAQPSTRLDPDEAREIARRAAAGESDVELLTMVTLSDGPTGRPVWIVSTAAVGNTLLVSVDDGNGEVLEMRRVGLR